MKTFITGDWHIGESRMNIMQRPFTSPDDMINTLIHNDNQIVTPYYIVIMVGDVCYQKTPQYLPRVNDFHGHKILIRGNHDRIFTDDELYPYFEQVISEGEGMDMDIHNIPCYITHYPTQGKKDRLNLVGHIHGAWKYQLNMLNVGVDVHHFQPISIESIPFHFEAITQHYDDDVWAAYHDINASYQGHRGKKESYFNAKL